MQTQMHMNNKDNNRIWELCVKQVNNSLYDAEYEEFEKIKDTKEAREALLQARQIYLKSSKSFIIQKIDKEKNWRHINSQISYGSRIKNLLIYISKYAAVFVAAFFIGVIAPKLFTLKSQEQVNNRIEMEWGQMSKITLSDGTLVWLNSGTIFEYPTTFNSKKRTVSIIGEAQFKVAHNDKIPFEVKTKSGIIKVHGTTFNVSAYKDDHELTVTLIEGKVTVEKNNGEYLATLGPSEQLCINKLNGEATLRKVDTDFYNSWVEGKILLNETKLSELTKRLERWYNVDIQLVGDSVGDIQISGTILKGKPLDLFLKILERMFEVKYEIITHNNKKDEVIIYEN